MHILIESIPKDFRRFIYLLTGHLAINDKKIIEREAYFYEDIDELDIRALSDSHFMLCMGRPHDEPIHQHGPFVD